jgi:hypothetical protein
MMHGFRRRGEGAQRFADRRLREDEAPRLQAEVPALAQLLLKIEDSSAPTGECKLKHVRHIVVDRAPAFFWLPCSEPRCRDGGHDVTAPIMQALRGHETEFEGDHTCQGLLGPSVCLRALHYDAVAKYRPFPPIS